MPLSKRSHVGEVEEITMTELRTEPGAVIDRVEHGATILIRKNARLVAKIVPIEEPKPLTFGLDLGEEYSELAR